MNDFLGTFQFTVSVDHLFFIGSQLVALSHTGKVGVWHAMTQHWQVGCLSVLNILFSFTKTCSFSMLIF